MYQGRRTLAPLHPSHSVTAFLASTAGLLPAPPPFPCSSQLMLNIPEPRGGRRSDTEEEPAAWLSPLHELDEEDEAEFKDGPDFLFSERCLVYCDLFTVSEIGGARRSRLPLCRELVPVASLCV